MIISNGKKIYPKEIEEVLCAFPGIIEATVIGVPDNLSGEAVKALVVMREGITVAEADIIRFCGNYLPDYKRPRSIEFYKEFPKNHRGKILKKILRDRYRSNSGIKP